MQQQNVNVLNLAEYVSLAASVVGSAAAVASQQMVYASAPLSLSLVLGLLNRRRETRELAQTSEAELKQFRDELFQVNLYLGNLEALRQKLLALPSPPEDMNLATVPEGWMQTVPAKVQSYEVAADVDVLATEVTAPPTPDVDAVNQAIAAIADLNDLDAVAMIGAIAPDTQAVPSTPTAPPLSESFTVDPSQIHQLQIGVERLQENLTYLHNSLNEQSQQVLTRLQQQINEELEALRHLMGQAPVSPTAATDLEALRQETLTRLSEGVAEILLEVRQSLAPLAGLDGAVLQQRLTQLQGEVADLQATVDSHQTEMPTTLTVELPPEWAEVQSHLLSELETIRTYLEQPQAPAPMINVQALQDHLSHIVSSGANASRSTIQESLTLLRMQLEDLQTSMVNASHQQLEQLRELLTNELNLLLDAVTTPIQKALPTVELGDWQEAAIAAVRSELRDSLPLSLQAFQQDFGQALQQDLAQGFRQGLSQAISEQVSQQLSQQLNQQLAAELRPQWAEPPVALPSTADLTAMQGAIIEEINQGLQSGLAHLRGEIAQLRDMVQTSRDQGQSAVLPPQLIEEMALLRHLLDTSTAPTDPELWRQETVAAIRDELQALLAPVNQLATLDPQAIHPAITQLRSDLAAELAMLRSQLQPPDITELTDRTQQILAELAHLREPANTTAPITSLDQVGLERQLAEFKQELLAAVSTAIQQQLSSQSNPNTPVVMDAAAIQTEIRALIQAEVQTALSDLVGTLRSEMTAQRADWMHRVNQQMAEVQGNLSKQVAQEVAQEMAALQTIPPSANQQAMQESLQTLRQLLEKQSSQSVLSEQDAANWQVVQSGISQLQTDMQQLQTTVQNLVANPLMDLAALQLQIDQISQQVEELGRSQDASELSMQVEMLRSAIARMEQEAENPPPEKDFNIIVAAIRSLHQRQIALGEAINAMQQ